MNNLHLESNPVANENNIIKGENYRITVLTASLFRLEYSKNGSFVDEPTQTVLNRNFPPVSYKLKEEADFIEIETCNAKLYYNKKEFSTNGLNIKIYGTNMHYNSEWYYGKEAPNLGGTARTLDNVNGATKLEDGILSRNGFALLDDSKSLIITEDYVKPRDTKDSEDLYVFCYGHQYRDAIKDFYYLCGGTPLLPRFALGNWWSRYYRYSEESYMKLMDDFAREDIPFSVAVIDMDWHLVNIDKKYGSGWTGYTWNRELFPEPKRFLENLHDRGMHITLNVHPAEGVRGFEDAYETIGNHMGVNVAEEEPVEFDIANPKFMECYFNDVHHPMEEDGVDFWWVDWQQGNTSKLEGLDPLWMLNHYHFLDNGRDGKRAMTFSRYAGPGSHRYPIGFSGDSHITWESLDFQPYFTATASNIGYGWWSHDIGGHMLGERDEELELRWYQFGVFSPIMRLHSSCNEFTGKEPWKFSMETHAVMNDFLRLRHRMIPYLYSMNYLASNGRPLISPMYYDYPDEWDAYAVKNQYYFGTELIVAPITSKCIDGVNRAKVKVWLPKGTYFDIFSDTVYTGDRFINMYRDKSAMPVLAKAGAILPLTNEIFGKDFLNNPSNLTVTVYPGADNSFELYEDDGETNNFKNGQYAITTLINGNSTSEFIIKKPEGDISVLPVKRNIQIHFCATYDNKAEVYIGDKLVEAMYAYDEKSHTFVVDIKDWDYSDDIKICLGKQHMIRENDVKSAVYEILNKAEISFIQKEDVYRPIMGGRSKDYVISELSGRNINVDVRDAVVEQILAYIE